MEKHCALLVSAGDCEAVDYIYRTVAIRWSEFTARNSIKPLVNSMMSNLIGTDSSPDSSAIKTKVTCASFKGHTALIKNHDNVSLDKIHGKILTNIIINPHPKYEPILTLTHT